MPIPQARDVDVTRTQLTAWLARKLPHARDVTIGEIGLPSGSGFSNETLLIDASWNENAAPVTARLVARVKPTAYAIFPEYDLHRQYRVMELLAPTPVPVPRMRWYEDDASVLGQPFSTCSPRSTASIGARSASSSWRDPTTARRRSRSSSATPS
jgi:aminoglycoside phosphotransferase (APT) family kinase protein